jgi:hypothetical protein
MPVTIRKLSAEEAQRAFARRGQQDLSEYVDALRELDQGQAAAVTRQGLSDRAIKRRLGQAANQLGYRLKWSRQSDPDHLYFQTLGQAPTKPTNGRRRRRTPAADAVGLTRPPASRPRRGRRRAVS